MIETVNRKNKSNSLIVTEFPIGTRCDEQLFYIVSTIFEKIVKYQFEVIF